MWRGWVQGKLGVLHTLDYEQKAVHETWAGLPFCCFCGPGVGAGVVVFDRNFWFTLREVNTFFFGGGAGGGLLSLAVGGFSWVSWVSSGCCCCCSWRTSLSLSPWRPLSTAVSWLSGVPFSSSGIMRLGCILHEHSIHTWHPHSTRPGANPETPRGGTLRQPER